jgi:hypothetical protein
MSRLERTAIVVTPLVAMATLALGLKIGASRAVRAAVMYGAPPAGGRAGLAWQLVTLLDDRGVRESVAIDAVSVIARHGSKEARWEGSTNEDGVAEVWLDLPDVHSGDNVELQVRTPSESGPLAEGKVSWGSGEARDAEAGHEAFVRPSKREGALSIDVAVYGGRMAPGYGESVWVRVTDAATGAAVPFATVTGNPEPGLTLASPSAKTCVLGWADLRATSAVHVAALGLVAENDRGQKGDWYGSLPIAPGAVYAAVSPRVDPERETRIDVEISTVRHFVYAEVDDAKGRDFAAIIVPNDVGSERRATLVVPPLGPGDYWLVTAGDPRGAEQLTGAAVARPFVVADVGATNAQGGACGLGPILARRAAPPFPRFVALDGVPGRHAQGGNNHLYGLVIAFGSLATAALLETLLVLRSASRARRELLRLSNALAEGGATPELASFGGPASVVIGVLLAVLGFALIAAILTWRAS